MEHLGLKTQWRISEGAGLLFVDSVPMLVD